MWPKPVDYYDPGTPKTEPGTPMASPNAGRTLPAIPGGAGGAASSSAAAAALTPVNTNNVPVDKYYDPGTPASPMPIQTENPHSPAPAPGDMRASIGGGEGGPSGFDEEEEDEHGYTGDDPARISSRLSAIRNDDSCDSYSRGSANTIQQKEDNDNLNPVQGLMSGFMSKQPVRKVGTNNKEDNVGEWKRRYFILSPMVLSYYVDYIDMELHDGRKPQGEVQIFPHTMVQKCAAESMSGGQEFIFRLLNSVTGESIRIGCTRESTRDLWMQCILNAANNLQGKGFMADTFGCYGNMLTGYKKKYFVLVGNSLHRFASANALTIEEECMSINKKTKLERVEESKGRLVLINATGGDGPTKYQLQLDTNGVPKSQFAKWLTAFQSKIQEGHADDHSEMHTMAFADDPKYDDSSEGSDVEMTPDVPVAAAQKPPVTKIAPKVRQHSIYLPVGDTPESTTAFASQYPNLKASTTPALKPGTLPSRPTAGPPVVHEVPPAAVPEAPIPVGASHSSENAQPAELAAPAPAPTSASLPPPPHAAENHLSLAEAFAESDLAPTPAPAATTNNPEMEALVARLAQLEAEAKEQEAKKAAKALKKSNKLLGIKPSASAAQSDDPIALQSKKGPGSSDHLHHSQEGHSSTGEAAVGRGKEKGVECAPLEAKKMGNSGHTKAFLDAVYGTDSEDSKEEEDKDREEHHKSAPGEDKEKHAHHKHHKHHKHHHHQHHLLLQQDLKKHHKHHHKDHKDDDHKSDSKPSDNESDLSHGSKSKRPDSRRLSTFNSEAAAAVAAAAGGAAVSSNGNGNGNGSPRSFGESQQNKPFVKQLFEKYCTFEEETIDVRGIQRLYYDHGIFKPVDRILQSMWGIGEVQQHTTFSSANFNYDDFTTWYRVKGTVLNDLKLTYTFNQDSRAAPSFPFFNRIKVCMLFRGQDEKAEFDDLKGYLDAPTFRQLHEVLMDQALIGYVIDDDDGREREPTCKESIENIVQIAEHHAKASVSAKLNMVDKSRVSTSKKIFLEDYVTWMTEFGVEQIKSQVEAAIPVEPPKKKGFASATRNAFRGLFGLKKAVKPVSTQEVFGTVYNNAPQPIHFHADKQELMRPDPNRPSITSNYTEDTDDDDDEEQKEIPRSIPHESTIHDAHEAALARYNEGTEHSLEKVEEEDSSSSDDSDDTVDVNAALNRDLKHRSVTNTDALSDKDQGPLPTSEDLFHHMDGPIHGESEHIYKALNDTEDNRKVSSAFADAFGGEVSVTANEVDKPAAPPGHPAAAKPTPPGPPVAASAEPPAKPLSALERMALAKKIAPPGPPTAVPQSPANRTSEKAARPKSVGFHEVLPKKAMTLKEKMAAAVEARKKQKDLEKSSSDDSESKIVANAFSDSAADFEQAEAAKVLSAAKLALDKVQPPAPDANHHHHHHSIKDAPKSHRANSKLAIEVQTNSVSWGKDPKQDPKKSHASNTAASSEPVYKQDFMFDEYSSGVAPIALDMATPVRRTSYFMSNNLPNTGKKLSTKQKAAQKKTPNSKSGGFFAPTQRKVVAAFRPVVAETGLDLAQNAEPVTPSVSQKAAPTAAELAVLRQLGFDTAPAVSGEEWERKESDAPVGEDWEKRAGLTPIASQTPGSASTPKGHASFLFTPQTVPQANADSADALLPAAPIGRLRRSSVTTFAGSAAMGANMVCSSVQTGDSGVGQSYIIAGFEGNHKHKHKHSKQVQLLKAEMSAAAAKAEAAARNNPNLVANASEEELSQHVPKSAFHLILGERYAVDDMWIRVREEEAKIALELEQAEEDAANRIRHAEMESLLKVQYAWSERHAWQVKAQHELSIAQSTVDQEAHELEVRRNAAASMHKQRTADFTSAYSQLQTHFNAVEKEKGRLLSKQIRLEMENAMQMLVLKDSQQELSDLLQKSKQIHAKHLSLDREVAILRQKRLPHYMQHGLESDRFLEGLEQDGHGVGANGHADATTAGHTGAHASHTASRLLFANATNANSVEKAVVFHKYDPNSVKLNTHTAAQAKEAKRRASVNSDVGHEMKGEMNFRSKEHEEHLKKYKNLYNQHPETHDHLQVPTRKQIDDLTPAQVLAKKERAEKIRLEQLKNQGPLSMSVRSVAAGATKGNFLKRGGGTGGTVGKNLAKHWKAGTQDQAPAAREPVYQPPAAQAKKPHYAASKAGSGTPPPSGKGKNKVDLPFSPEIYTGMDTRVSAPKDHRGHYDIGMIVHQNKYVPLHTRGASPSQRAKK